MGIDIITIWKYHWQKLLIWLWNCYAESLFKPQIYLPSLISSQLLSSKLMKDSYQSYQYMYYVSLWSRVATFLVLFCIL